MADWVVVSEGGSEGRDKMTIVTKPHRNPSLEKAFFFYHHQGTQVVEKSSNPTWVEALQL